MKQRPLLIWTIVIIHFLEPILKTGLLSVMTSNPLLDVIRDSESYGMRQMLEYWLLFPIGGIALLLMRNWSFWVFIGVQAYSIIALATQESYSLAQASANPYLATIALVFANAIFIFYVFAPNIRDLFFDPHTRRWEVRARHRLTIPCSLKIEDKTDHIEVEIKNISETGAFIVAPLNIERDEPVLMHFKFYNLHFTIWAKIVHAHEIAGEKGLGVQFQFADLNERLQIKRLNKALELLGL